MNYSNLTKLLLSLFCLGFFLFISQKLDYRFDGTSERKNTLSDHSLSALKEINEPLIVKIYLHGKLPSNFRILRDELTYKLKSMNAINQHIQFSFVDPNYNQNKKKHLIENGFTAYNIPIENGFLNIYPFFEVFHQDKSLLQDILVNNTLNYEQRAIASIQNLEYTLMNAIIRMLKNKKQKVGILTHHDELPKLNRLSLENELKKYYEVEVIENKHLKSNKSFDYSDLDDLKKFDALIIAKPVLPFKDIDKLVLDQYLMNGGKIIMSVETVDAEMDSLYKKDRIIAFPRNLNLNDWLFNYNLRIKKGIVKDLQSAPIVLATGESGKNTSFNSFPWPFFPVSFGNPNHNITGNLGPVKFEFANPIEIVNNQTSIRSTVLLRSSSSSSLFPSLGFIDFSFSQDTNPYHYQKKNQNLAVLIEGEIESAYKNRLERKEIKQFKASTKEGKLLLISDGDFMKNQLIRGKALTLGADKYSLRPDRKKTPSAIYFNQDFILNSLSYMLDKNGIHSIAKNKHIVLLDKIKIQREKEKWQILAILAPILFVFLIGVFFISLRRYMI